MVRRLHQLARKKSNPLYMCFVGLGNAYDSVDRTLLWAVLPRFGVPPKKCLRLFTASTMECVRASGRTMAKYSDWFGVEKGLWRGCVLAPLLFNMLFTAVPRVAVKRCSANADVKERCAPR